MIDLDNLIKKLKEDSLTNSDISYLLEYLKESHPKPEIESLFQKSWDETSDINNEVDLKWIYSQILSKVSFSRVIDQGNRLASSNEQYRLRNLKKYWIPSLRYAAVFILAFVLFWLVRPVPEVMEPVIFADQFQRISVPFGSKTKVILPDGSVIILNSGSDLSYSYAEFLSGRRGVILEGEGFFSVEKDLNRPFYVTTQGMRLKVLGTSFNVKAYPDEDIEEATLITGSVEIFAGSDIKENGKPLLLKPNEKAVISKLRPQKSRKEVISKTSPIEPIILKSLELQDDTKKEQVISWKDNRLIFDNEPFKTLLVKIERWYDVEITVDYPELNNARFTGKFDKETVEQVMTALSTITPFKFDMRKNQITIMKK